MNEFVSWSQFCVHRQLGSTTSSASPLKLERKCCMEKVPVGETERGGEIGMTATDLNFSLPREGGGAGLESTLESSVVTGIGGELRGEEALWLTRSRWI